MPDVQRPYWFHAKRYGWGWGLPASWQGWVVLIAWLAIIICVSPLLTAHHFPLFFVFMGVMAVLLIAICYAKGEPTHWRWGDKNSHL